MTPAPSVGVVGLGFGRAHVPGFQAAGCRVVALCQRDEAGARALAERYGVPHVYTRWEALIDEARPDIVVVATPPHLHRAIALRAFATGAHVLCEKPLALDRAEGQAMVEAAARAGRVGMTCFNWRFLAAMQELHTLVESGSLGRLFHVGARWLGSRWARLGDAGTWRMDRAQAGFGALGDMGVHLVDLVRWNFGEIVRVCARAGVAYPERAAPGLSRPADAEDHCAVIGELASGATLTLATSRVARGMGEQSLEAYGSGGGLTYRMRRDGERWWEGELHATGDGDVLRAVTPRHRPDPALARGDQLEITGRMTIAPLVTRLREGIRTGATPGPSLADGERAQAVLDAIGESVARGGWASVPSAAPPANTPGPPASG